MLRNYFKVAFRTLMKNKVLGLINIAGLAIGISACLLITLYVLDELSYDRFHERAGRIYRLTPIIHLPNEDRHSAMTSPSMGQWLNDNFPEVLSTVRIGSSRRTLSRGEIRIYNTEIWYADSTLFEIFSYPMLRGNPETALVEPYSIVLTERSAKKYFGDEDPLDKTIILSDTIPFMVTGVIENIPSSTHLPMDVILSRSTVPAIMHFRDYDKVWFYNVMYTYVLLTEDHDARDLEEKIKPVLEKEMVIRQKEQEVNISYDFKLQPLDDIHLKSHLQGEVGVNGNLSYVYTFMVVAALVLLIACANYVNLSTARSIGRSKEVGMRKVVGARQPQLITQLLGESVMMTVVAFLLALIIVQLSLPSFNTFAGKSMSFNLIQQPLLVAVILGAFLLVSLLAGGYPAIFMSSFSPIKVLRNKVRSSRQNSMVRKGLVVFQFTVSIILITGMLVIVRQMNYIRSRNLGLSRDQIVSVKLRLPILRKQEMIKVELLKTPGVMSISATDFSYSLPIVQSLVWPEGAEENNYSTEAVICADHDFIKTFSIQLVAGRYFSKDYPNDESDAFIINESAVEHFKWGTPDLAIGKKIYLAPWGKWGKVVGVMKDFNFSSLHEPIKTLVIHNTPDYQFFAIKVTAENIPATMRALQHTWDGLQLAAPFDYSFMDDDFQKLYKAEEQTQTLIGLLSALAIFVACLGLFGLAAFMAEQRMKEISIRKVLGADVLGITGLLSRDFLTLIFISIIMAIPVAWYALTRWLESFAYKTAIPWWVFLIAGGCAFGVALLTVSYQSIKAALRNPIEALRLE